MTKHSIVGLASFTLMCYFTGMSIASILIRSLPDYVGVITWISSVSAWVFLFLMLLMVWLDPEEL